MKLNINFGLTGILLAALLLAAVPAHAQSDAFGVVIERMAGTVEVRHSELTDDEWRMAEKGESIGAGWKLRTGDESKVQLLFPQDNVLILKQNSELVIDRLSADGGASLEALGGGILVNIQNALSPGSQFEVKTPTALAVVRGTEWGMDEIDEFDCICYGYDGTVALYTVDTFGDPDPDSRVDLTIDTEVLASYGNLQGPDPAGSGAQLFRDEMLDTSLYEAYEQALQDLADALRPFRQRADDLYDKLSDYEREWSRYERNDQRFQMLYLYVQVLYAWDELDELGEDYASFLKDAEPRMILPLEDGLANSAFSGFDDSSDPRDSFNWYRDQLELLEGISSPELRDGIGELLRGIATTQRDAYEILEGFMDDAEPFIDTNQDLIDQLQGLIQPSGNPALSLRWKLFDTDNDGISDVDETMLGLDPFDNNSDGFITLLDPDDGEELLYPDDSEVEFVFEELDTDFIEQYDLVLTSSRGRQWVARDVDNDTTVETEFLFGNGGIFADDIVADGSGRRLDLTWQIVAKVDEDELFAGIAAANPDFASAFGGTIASEVRQLAISAPFIDQQVVIDLEGVGRTDVTWDGQLFSPDTLRIRGLISDVSDLRRWSITVLFDPNVLEFERGRRSGLFSGSTVFFSNNSSGVVTISGQVPAGDAGITGNGEIFVLEFRPAELGFTTVEVDEAELSDSFDNPIDAEPGDDVDVSVDSVTGATAGARDRFKR
ncbi:FecR domain-containing protein [bacterium]|nr:FecR domain-containing protein [bacterium]